MLFFPSEFLTDLFCLALAKKFRLVLILNMFKISYSKAHPFAVLKHIDVNNIEVQRSANMLVLVFFCCLPFADERMSGNMEIIFKEFW